MASAPGRFNLKERVTVDWRVEDGYWRISRIALFGLVAHGRAPGAAAVLNREGSIELRVLPDGNYLVFLAEDSSAPAFRGRYRLEGNKIIVCGYFVKRPAATAKRRGKLSLCAHGDGLDLRKVQDENAWRAERFEGVWSAAH